MRIVLAAACFVLFAHGAVFAQADTRCQHANRPEKPIYGKLGLIAAIGQSLADDQNFRDCQRQEQLAFSTDSSAVARHIRAQWDLFLPRARMVMQHSVDSLGLRDSTMQTFWSEASTALQNLWILDQEATTARMADAVAPATANYARRVAEYNQRCAAVFNEVADSLHMQEAERNSLIPTLNARLVLLEGLHIDAPKSEIRATILATVTPTASSRVP